MDSLSWTEKYRPDNFDDIFIQSSEKLKIDKWLQNFGKKQNKNEKHKNCLFIHGPPGIGKTTIAYALLKKYNYDIIEFNASDLRSQKILSEKISQINGNINIVNFMCMKKKKIGIIIDELDGINNTERGAISELTKIIEKSGINGSPFICITNTISKKLQALKKKSNYIRLNKPNRPTIIKLIKFILSKENIEINDPDIKLIIDKSQLDLRRTIILLEYLFKSKNTNKDIKISLEKFERKNQDISVFESTEMILSHYKTDFYDIYSSNKNMIGLYIYENFVNYIIKNRDEHNKKKIETITGLYDIFSLCDTLEYNSLIEHNHNHIMDNIICYLKCNFPSYKINNMKPFSYNKLNSLNYSTLLNKTSQEYQNSKSVIATSSLFDINYYNLMYIYDLCFVYFRDNRVDILHKIIKSYDISNTDFEKMITKSSFFNPEIHTNIKKKLKIIYSGI